MHRWMKTLGLMIAAFSMMAARADLPQMWTTEKGLKVIFKAAPDLPMVDVRLVFDAGSARDGTQWGLASMTSAQFALASNQRDEQTVAEGFEQIGARFSTSAHRDMAVVQLRSLTRQPLLDEALSLVSELLRQPAFDAQIFEREQARLRLALQEVKYSPSQMASQAFYRQLYGDHPYAHPSEGTPDTIDALTVEHLRSFYERFYVASNGVLALVGDLTLAQARALADRLDDALNKGQKAPALPAPSALTSAVQVSVPFESQQTQILMGVLGMTRNDPDYFALYLGNHILGGSGFGSRLMQEVREKRGLTYSVYSYFSPMQARGPFIMGTQTRNDRAQESLNVMRQTLAEFVEKGPTPEELRAAKDNVLGGFALKIDSNSEQVQYWAMIGFYDLPLSYLQDFKDQIRRVSVTDIRRAFARRIDPELLLEVRLGPQGVAQIPASTPFKAPPAPRAH